MPLFMYVRTTKVKSLTGGSYVSIGPRLSSSGTPQIALMQSKIHADLELVLRTVPLTAPACNVLAAGGAHGEHLRHVPVAQPRQTEPHEGVLSPLVKRRGLRDLPVHLVGHGPQLLELKARRWPLHLHHQVRRARIA